MQLSLTEYRTLVEQAPILVWRAGQSAECDYFNEPWLSFRGRTLEQECGNGWAEGVHPDDFDRCLEIYLTSFRQRVAFEMEYRLLRHDGVYRWIFDRGVPYYFDDGAFAGYIGSCIDVTPRVEAQQAVDEAHERELRDLRGLLAICAWCRKVKSGDGSWVPLEAYIARHSQADFTHGMCADCYETHRRR